MAERQVRLARDAQVVDRFQVAAKMIGDNEETVRLAGLTSLVEVARQNPREYFEPVKAIIIAFIQVKGRNLKSTEKSSRDITSFHENVEAFDSLNLVCNRHGAIYTNERFQNLPSWGLNPSATNGLRGDARRIKFQQISTNGVKVDLLSLYDSDFSGSELNYSIFTNCDLRKTNFSNCRLDHAVFENCDLQDSDFSGTDLANTKFMGGLLPLKILKGAIISPSIFEETNNQRNL